MKEKIEAKLKEYQRNQVRAEQQLHALNVAIEVCKQLLKEDTKKEVKEG